MEAKVIWKNKLSFTSTGENGYHYPFEMPNLQLAVKMNGFEPMELIAIGLAGCTAMDMISILQKKRQDVTCF